MSKPILAIDFDGTIHSYTSGWQGEENIPDPPVPGVAEALDQYAEHFEIVIVSSRAATLDGVYAIAMWLAKWELLKRWRDGGRVFEITDKKPKAKVTLDDRAITFTGRWPEVEELLHFEPWTKKPPRQEYLAMVEDRVIYQAEQLKKLERFLLDEFPDALGPGFHTMSEHAIRILSAYKADIGLPRMSSLAFVDAASESQPGAKEGVSSGD